MLFLHETHKVQGRKRREFESLFRDAGGWMDTLAKTEDDARLLWFAEYPQATGLVHTFVTVTGITDGAAWQRLDERAHDGDLADWRNRLDLVRHRSEARILRATDWSYLTDIDLATVPVEPQDRDTTMILEEWVRPHPGNIKPYLDMFAEQCVALYKDPGAAAFDEKRDDAPEEQTGYRSYQKGDSMWIDLLGAFTPTLGAGGQQHELMLWQPIIDGAGYWDFLCSEDPGVYPEGGWLDESGKLRDDFTSQLIRTSHWSPLDATYRDPGTDA